MLRAVLSKNECEQVISKHTATFFGEQFPNLGDGDNGAPDFAVLRFAAEEKDEKWRPGYYRLDSDLAEINNALRDLQR